MNDCQDGTDEKNCPLNPGRCARQHACIIRHFDEFSFRQTLEVYEFSVERCRNNDEICETP